MKVKVSGYISIFLWALFFSHLFVNPASAQLQPQKARPGDPSERLAPIEKTFPLQPQKTRPGDPSERLAPPAFKREFIQAQVKPEAIRIFKRTPIQFKPYTYRDFKNPKTGQTLTPDQIVTLSHLTPPRQIRGDQFISEVNRFEKYYNAFGYTNRDRGEVIVGEIVMNKELLKTQAGRINSIAEKFDPAMRTKPLDSQTFQRLHKENINLAQAVSKELKQAPPRTSPTSPTARSSIPLPKKGMTFTEAERSFGAPEFKPIYSERHWNETYGDPDVIAVHQKIDIVHDGKKEKLHTSANSELGITLFNSYYTLVGATADVTAPGPDATDSNVHVYWHIKTLNGIKQPPVNIPATSNYSYPRQKTTIIDVPPQFVGIPIPVPVSVRIGYGGSIAIWLQFSITPLAINCTIEPEVEIHTAFQFGTGILIAEVGVQGDTLLLKDAPKLIGELTVKPYTPPAISGLRQQLIPAERADQFAPSPKLVFQAVSTCEDSIVALRGDLYLYFKVDLWLWEKTWKTLIYRGNSFIGIDRYLIQAKDTQYYYV